MERVKRWIRRYGGKKLQDLIIWGLRVTGIRNRIILFSPRVAQKKKVNIHYWSGEMNLGDAISPLVVKHVAEWKKVDIYKNLEKTKHLFAVGSIITAGCQDCTIWGSGLLNTTRLSRLEHRKLDIRAVRGPLTRMVLMEHGFSVPEVYGDPAILMPLIYNPEVEKKYKVSIIPHMEDQGRFWTEEYHMIDIRTDDYEYFVREIKASEIVFSSSLHGIILAETYGIPAVLLKPRASEFKYMDYYLGTNRNNYPVADSIRQALKTEPVAVPDFSTMREALINSFPVDIWS